MADLNAKLSNSAFLEYATSDDPGMNKKAQNTAEEFTRVKMREESCFDPILPPVQVSDDELDRQPDTDKPVIVIDKEPGVPASLTVPFATTPMGRYIRAPRYRVMFGRIQSPKITKDIDELRTYHMDVRQVISDNMIKDMLAEKDGKWIYASNNAMGGAAGATVSETGAVQWRSTTAEVTRDSIAESTKIMPSTSSRLEPAVGLINNITVKDVLKWERPEVGGDLSQDLLVDGFTMQKIFGIKWVVTIKHDLVPTNTIFYYAEPKFLGKHFVLVDTTMHLDRRATYIEFFAYHTLGAAIGNVAGVARQDFNAEADS